MREDNIKMDTISTDDTEPDHYNDNFNDDNDILISFDSVLTTAEFSKKHFYIFMSNFALFTQFGLIFSSLFFNQAPIISFVLKITAESVTFFYISFFLSLISGVVIGYIISINGFRKSSIKLSSLCTSLFHFSLGWTHTNRISLMINLTLLGGALGILSPQVISTVNEIFASKRNKMLSHAFSTIGLVVGNLIANFFTAMVSETFDVKCLGATMIVTSGLSILCSVAIFKVCLPSPQYMCEHQDEAFSIDRLNYIAGTNIQEEVLVHNITKQQLESKLYRNSLFRRNSVLPVFLITFAIVLQSIISFTIWFGFSTVSMELGEEQGVFTYYAFLNQFILAAIFISGLVANQSKGRTNKITSICSNILLLLFSILALLNIKFFMIYLGLIILCSVFAVICLTFTFWKAFYGEISDIVVFIGVIIAALGGLFAGLAVLNLKIKGQFGLFILLTLISIGVTCVTPHLEDYNIKEGIYDREKLTQNHRIVL